MTQVRLANLGYASTAHRSQGLTVDTAHAIITSQATRELLYVAMTRGRSSNTAHVATDQSDPLRSGLVPGGAAPSGKAVLEQVVRATAAEPSAHQAAAEQRGTWHGIGQLAAEYETIANAASRAHFAHLIETSGIDPDTVQQVTASPSFPTLTGELRRLDATGANTTDLLPRVAHLVQRAPDPAAALCRIAAAVKPARPRLGAPRPRLIAGLIPEANCPMAPDMRAALDQRANLIRHRANQLAGQAILNREPWLRELGPAPADPGQRRQWEARAATIAAYRDRWNHTGLTAVRPNPTSRQERIDAARVQQAMPHRIDLPQQSPRQPTRPVGLML